MFDKMLNFLDRAFAYNPPYDVLMLTVRKVNIPTSKYRLTLIYVVNSLSLLKYILKETRAIM